MLLCATSLFTYELTFGIIISSIGEREVLT